MRLTTRSWGSCVAFVCVPLSALFASRLGGHWTKSFSHCILTMDAALQRMIHSTTASWTVDRYKRLLQDLTTQQPELAVALVLGDQEGSQTTSKKRKPDDAPSSKEAKRPAVKDNEPERQSHPGIKLYSYVTTVTDNAKDLQANQSTPTFAHHCPQSPSLLTRRH